MRTLLLLALVVLPLLGQPTKPPPGAQVDWSNPINDGLVGWWLFNEGAGSRLNDIAGRNHGVLTNMDPATDWVGSIHGAALDFDGNNDYVNVGSDATLNPAFMSGFAWINPATTQDNNWAIILARFSSGDAYHFSLGNGSSGFKLTIFIDTSAGGQNVSITDTITPEIWSHVGFTYDGANLRLWVNGIENNSVTHSGGIDVVSLDTNIGRKPAGGDVLEYTGLIDDVRIWKQALTAAEVQQLHHFPYGGILHIVERLTRWFVEPAVGGKRRAVVILVQ